MRRFLPALIGIFLLAAWLRVDFFYTLAYLLLGVYVFSRLWIWRCHADLRVERRIPTHAYWGDHVDVEVIVRNRGWLPIPWLHVHESLPVELHSPPFHQEVVSLGPRGVCHIRYTLDCRRRGRHAVGPFRVQLGDTLGLVEPLSAEVGPAHIVVYPRVLPLPALGIPARSPLARLRALTPLYEDPTRIAGVRPYSVGEPLRRIHWAASAHTGSLLVKQYQPGIARETLIFLDLDRAAYAGRAISDAVELAVTAAASLATHIVVRERQAIGLATMVCDEGGEAGHYYAAPHSQRAYLMAMLETLAQVQAGPETSFEDRLERASSRMPWGSTLVIITGRSSASLTESCLALRSRGFAVVLLLLRPVSTAAEAQMSGLQSMGPDIHFVWEERDLLRV